MNKNTDMLIIKELTIATQVGVHAWEQRIKQNVLIDISIPSDFSSCQDKIENTIDYDALCKAITEFVQAKSFQLIETIAHDVAALIQDLFKVKQLSVAVSKPNAVAHANKIQVVVNLID